MPLGRGSVKETAGLKPGDRVVQWTSDRTALLVATASTGDVFAVERLDVESGKRSAFREIRLSRPGTAEHLLLTTDGSGYAYEYSRKRSDLYLAEGIR